jgi:hypothetical protein
MHVLAWSTAFHSCSSVAPGYSIDDRGTDPSAIAGYKRQCITKAVYAIAYNIASKFLSAYNSSLYFYLFSLNKWPVLFLTSWRRHTPCDVYSLFSCLVCMFRITLDPLGPLIWNCVWLCPFWLASVFLLNPGLVRTLNQNITTTLGRFLDLRHFQWWPCI